MSLLASPQTQHGTIEGVQDVLLCLLDACLFELRSSACVISGLASPLEILGGHAYAWLPCAIHRAATHVPGIQLSLVKIWRSEFMDLAAHGGPTLPARPLASFEARRRVPVASAQTAADLLSVLATHHHRAHLDRTSVDDVGTLLFSISRPPTNKVTTGDRTEASVHIVLVEGPRRSSAPLTRDSAAASTGLYYLLEGAAGRVNGPTRTCPLRSALLPFVRAATADRHPHNISPKMNHQMYFFSKGEDTREGDYFTGDFSLLEEQQQEGLCRTYRGAGAERREFDALCADIRIAAAVCPFQIRRVRGRQRRLLLKEDPRLPLPPADRPPRGSCDGVAFVRGALAELAEYRDIQINALAALDDTLSDCVGDLEKQIGAAAARGARLESTKRKVEQARKCVAEAERDVVLQAALSLTKVVAAFVDEHQRHNQCVAAMPALFSGSDHLRALEDDATYNVLPCDGGEAPSSPRVWMRGERNPLLSLQLPSAPLLRPRRKIAFIPDFRPMPETSFIY